MPTADAEHGCRRLANEAGKVFKDFRFIVIEVSQRTAEHDRMGLKLGNAIGECSHVDDARLGLLNQTLDVGNDILQSQNGNLALALELNCNVFSPIRSRHLRQIAFVAEQVVDNQHARLIDTFLNRLVVAERALIEGEGKRLNYFRALSFAGDKLVCLRGHQKILATKRRQKHKTDQR